MIRRLLHTLPKVDACKRYVIADILNEWSLLFIKRYFDFAKDLNLVCSSTAKELIKSKESSHKQLEKEINKKYQSCKRIDQLGLTPSFHGVLWLCGLGSTLERKSM